MRLFLSKYIKTLLRDLIMDKQLSVLALRSSYSPAMFCDSRTNITGILQYISF